MDVKTIGNLIRKARKKQKFTQSEAAGFLNVGTRFLSDLENGKPTVQLEKALKVLEGVGFTVLVVPKSNCKLIKQAENCLDAE